MGNEITTDDEIRALKSILKWKITFDNKLTDEQKRDLLNQLKTSERLQKRI